MRHISLLSVRLSVSSVVVISILVLPADDNICVARLVARNSFNVSTDVACALRLDKFAAKA
jgi:hypothetical protein